MPLTLTQNEAINSTNRSTVVIAGAGSGKTKVLVEHFKKLITNQGVLPHRILAFTFTNKAAQEIKSRIFENQILEPWQQTSVSIETIHSFCALKLRRYGPLIGLNPDFSITNEAESRLTDELTIKAWVREKMRQNNPALNPFIKNMG